MPSLRGAQVKLHDRSVAQRHRPHRVYAVIRRGDRVLRCTPPPVDREALHLAQEANDTMMAFQALRRAYNIDVAPITAMARMEASDAIDVLRTYRESKCRDRKTRDVKLSALMRGSSENGFLRAINAT